MLAAHSQHSTPGASCFMRRNYFCRFERIFLVYFVERTQAVVRVCAPERTTTRSLFSRGTVISRELTSETPLYPTAKVAGLVWSPALNWIGASYPPVGYIKL